MSVDLGTPLFFAEIYDGESVWYEQVRICTARHRNEWLIDHFNTSYTYVYNGAHINMKQDGIIKVWYVETLIGSGLWHLSIGYCQRIDKVMKYHVAPSSARQSILDNGIDYTIGKRLLESEYNGNYLLLDMEIAGEIVSYLYYDGNVKSCDVWEVDDSTLIVEPDPRDTMVETYGADDPDMVPDWYMVRDAIPSSCIRLVKRNVRST